MDMAGLSATTRDKRVLISIWSNALSHNVCIGDKLVKSRFVRFMGAFSSVGSFSPQSIAAAQGKTLRAVHRHRLPDNAFGKA